MQRQERCCYASPVLHLHAHVTKMAVVSLADIAQIAKEKLDRNAYSYFSSGSDEEQTLRDNEEAFRR